MTATTDTHAAAPHLGTGARARNTWATRTWTRYVVRRLGVFALSLWMLVTFAFAMIHLIPGDPVRAALGVNASPELVAARRAELHLDEPLLSQYVRYLGGLVSGDWGVSLQSRLPVTQVIAERLPNTLLLAGLTFVVTLLIALPIGTGMAVLTQHGRHRLLELGYTGIAMVVSAVPEFLMGVVLVYVFAVRMEVLPIAGNAGPGSVILPVAALSLGSALALSRIVRVELLSVLGRDFVRTARAKRLRPRRVYLRHALPNALTATITLGGLLLSGLIASTVIVESIFAWPGLGPTMVSSIITKDYPLMQAIVLIYGAMVLSINLVVDMVLSVLDPRSTIREA
ncbi:ABC transporter permease [uncultured Serinicoccus sp.]|uniref:ABC transporter permease n=1 Tax=uncultured Serinicoccus sp. TaxID=735514 RepID=UPI0026027B16|nr:ABC transporter permease [uncultured Serinicoccus sp.]